MEQTEGERNMIHTFVRGHRSPSDELGEDGSGQHTPNGGTTRPQNTAEESADVASATYSGPAPKFPLRGSLSKYSRRDKPEVKPSMAMRHQTYRRTSETRKLEEYKRLLRAERERLIGTTSGVREDNMRKMMELESLTNRNNAGKYEDELFDMRLEELQSAQALIQTGSSASERDIRRQIRHLNDEIARVASNVTETMTENAPHDGLEEIGAILGNGFMGFFPEPKTERSTEKLLVQAILRIFLARSSMFVINSWNLKSQKTSVALNLLCDRIRSEEEQMVAGKWRQIAFTQVPCGPNTKDLQEYANYKAQKVAKILACAGWAGDTEKIQQQVLQLMLRAERMRMDVKGGMISPDCQPWLAAYGEEYDTSTMRDVGVEFGMEIVKHARRHRVLGSPGLGLKVDGDVGVRTRVLLLESFQECHRRWSGR